mmetsp:Transcript_33597/g.78717  ORF Transcript_33597/g.78717 Transcript_33597/m.78717 type:complete len:289 (+) Transcript_33597:3-869(+)
MAELRQRAGGQKLEEVQNKSKKDEKRNNMKQYLLVVLGVGIGLLVLMELFQCPFFRMRSASSPAGDPSKVVSSRSGGRLFTKEELKAFDGSDSSKPLYLAIAGKVFDVTRGSKHYGPGGGYSFFAGIDGSRAFVTGQFNEKGLIDDLTGFTPEEYKGIDGWVSFYEKDYIPVGKVIGAFYDESGEPTKANRELQYGATTGLKEEERAAALAKEYPRCNSKWSQNAGSEVWCSKDSGGVARDWVGVPRSFIEPGQTKPRCACLSAKHLDNPNARVYDGCAPDAVRCKLK